MAKQPKNKTSDPEPEVKAPVVVEFKLARPIALGSGTRQAGEIVFTAEKVGRLWDPETVKKSENFTEYELVTVLQNPQLLAK